MEIKVFDNGGRTMDRFLVMIGQNAYLMSINANSPMGVNTYVGNHGDIECDDPLLPKRDWPGGLRRAINEKKQLVLSRWTLPGR